MSLAQAITFGFNRSVLDPDSFPLLTTLLDVIQRCPDLNVVVQDHTDSLGSESVNARISNERAQSVFDHLIALGVDNERMQAVGFGETQPLLQNDTSRNRARNRRIDFEVGG